jgi:hypothetical protein
MRRLDVGTHCDYRDGENDFLSLPEELGNGALSESWRSRRACLGVPPSGRGGVGRTGRPPHSLGAANRHPMRPVRAEAPIPCLERIIVPQTPSLVVALAIWVYSSQFAGGRDVLVLIPIFWIFSISLKPTPEILVTPTTLLPKEPTLDHYGVALSGDFRSYLVNSLIAAGGATVLGLLLSIPAAFGFAKYGYRGSGTLLSFIVVTRVFPPIALALPFFLSSGRSDSSTPPSG